jgi:hypothetical protein
MEWSKVWRTVFVGWDGDVDLTALADELRYGGKPQGARRFSAAPSGGDEADRASTWVRQQIQSAY